MYRLQNEKANETKKIADASVKINSASQAMSRTTIASTVKSKLGEIERYRKTQVTAEKKISEIEVKIGRKQKEINYEQKKITKEEESIEKKRTIELQKQTKEHQTRMNTMANTIAKHNSLHIETSKRIMELHKLPEKIVVLFLASNPLDQQQLRLDEEARSINENINKARHRDSVRLETRWAVRPIDILQAINELDPTIIHFSGHGTDTDDIVFQNSHGQAQLVSKDAIVQTMAASSGNIRMVFFNTCYSYNQAKDTTKYIDSAIGMNTSIGDDAARVFASQFYSAVGFGLSVKRAFEQARAAILLEGIDGENIPELFIQDGLDPDEIIFVKLQQ